MPRGKPESKREFSKRQGTESKQVNRNLRDPKKRQKGTTIEYRKSTRI
jgi:hypothetical protein